MTIKSDRWIRRMAEQHGMIEPFEPGQIKHGTAGQRLVSYGTSSYGYDVRCADEFKIFTNINSTIVDPKNFDPKSFVDVKGPECIIPPNSFALARTVEYFRIPRNVLVVCLGKSTYARCFSGDTRVALVDGSAPTFEEMAARHQEGELFWGYGVGIHGKIQVVLLDAPRYIGSDGLVEITLDDGSCIKCTPDHLILTREGEMKAAGDLRPGFSLMPLYRGNTRGYPHVLQPLTGHLYPTHRLADEWNLQHGIYQETLGGHRHHVDHNKQNNRPTNILRVPAVDHISYHNSHFFGEGFDSVSHGKRIAASLAEKRQDPAWDLRYRQAQSNRVRSFWDDPRYAVIRRGLIEKRQNMTIETRNKMSASHKLRYENPEERVRQAERMRLVWHNQEARKAAQANIARNLRLRSEITAEAVASALQTSGTIREAARLLQCDRAVFRRFPEVMAHFRASRLQEAGVSHPNNHKVVSVRELPGTHDVYCLTSPETGNFALEAGVFVKNCGLIVNVTPLEPEWEGHVTLEFSNTTPLPARIYANEGVAQMLFFESDEPCETSYKDRGGKYQGQLGVTIPRV